MSKLQLALEKGGWAAFNRGPKAAGNGQGRRRVLNGLFGATFLLFAGIFGPASASTADNRKVVGNVEIYLGVIPAAMVRGEHPAAHTEATMHGGLPRGSDEYHVLVTLFDAASGKRIGDAKVSARVAEIGLGGEEKPLQPMNIDGMMSFGNFFHMHGDGPFRIQVTIRLSGHPGVISVNFDHWHS